jgi:hypothetical protein
MKPSPEVRPSKGAESAGIAHNARVGTDNWPVDFRYISKRLTREIVDQHEAARPGGIVSAAITLRGVSLGLRGRDPDYANRFDLARRASIAISDNTGTLENGGEYVRAELDVVPVYFKVHFGWRRGRNQEIAAFFAESTSGSGGRTFVGLFGSISNFTGRKPEEEQPGWWPSDVTGLYHILDAALEQSDQRPSADYLDDDLASDHASSISMAMIIFRHMAKRFPAERLEFLAKSFVHSHDVTALGAIYETVVIGAPIWVATPKPGPLEIE